MAALLRDTDREPDREIICGLRYHHAETMQATGDRYNAELVHKGFIAKQGRGTADLIPSAGLRSARFRFS